MGPKRRHLRHVPNARALAVRYDAGMSTTLKITRIGGSAGIILPKALLEQLCAQVGDELTVIETENGIGLIARYADTDQQLAVAKEVMARRRRALMALADEIDEIMDNDRAILAAFAKS